MKFRERFVLSGLKSKFVLGRLRKNCFFSYVKLVLEVNFVFTMVCLRIIGRSLFFIEFCIC